MFSGSAFHSLAAQTENALSPNVLVRDAGTVSKLSNFFNQNKQLKAARAH
jgi:hypothetical protein